MIDQRLYVSQWIPVVRKRFFGGQGDGHPKVGPHTLLDQADQVEHGDRIELPTISIETCIECLGDLFVRIEVFVDCVDHRENKGLDALFFDHSEVLSQEKTSRAT